MKNNTLLIGGGIIAIIVGLFIANYFIPSPKDAFAQCLADKGTIFYGAFWCPHCKEQKQVFGKSARYLPYVECSTPDGKGLLPVCEEAGITGFPTWRFADGTELKGFVSLEDLASRTSCEL